jgi:hypothetical protein
VLRCASGLGEQQPVLGFGVMHAVYAIHHAPVRQNRLLIPSQPTTLQPFDEHGPWKQTQREEAQIHQ